MNKILNFKGDHQGLGSHEAEQNLLLYGHNCAGTDFKQEELPKIRFYGVFKSLRLYLMLAATILYLLGGFALQGTLLLLLVLGYCFFEIVMENQCDEKLQKLIGSDVMVRVVRDNKIVVIKRENVVQDDLIILQGGENVPADAHILEASNVTVDERNFTNSSVPVKKHPGSDGNHELKLSCVYKGTRVVSGILIARVFAIGEDVKIRPEVRTAKDVYYTEFESSINKLSVLFTYAAAVLLTVTAIVSVITAGSPVVAEGSPEASVSLLSHLITVILPAFSFALCVVPVSLSLAVRIYYVNGAVRLSEKYGEIKSLRALETLNSISAVCLDKDSLIVSGHTPIVAESAPNSEMLARIAALSCKKVPAAELNSYEKAISINAAFKHIDMKELHQNRLIRSYVPENDADYNKIHGNLWDVNGAKLLCVKGSPDVILSFCKIPPEQLYPIQKKQSDYAKEGHHVMAVAFAKVDDTDKDGKTIIPDTLLELEYSYLGIMAFSESVKESVSDAVKSCYRAGVKVFMLTTADKEAALTIARKAGIKDEGVLVGRKVEAVETLRGAKEVVAVFGGGTEGRICSCTEALESADIGIALSKYTTGGEWDMGLDTFSQHTTGSACEACELILENSPDGIEDGFVKLSGILSHARQLHRNVKNCISIAISTFTALVLFGLINLFIRGIYVPEAVLVSTLTALVIPVLMMFFFTDNNADLKCKMKPSAFIGKGRINKNYLIGACIQGGVLFAVSLIMFLIFRSFEGYIENPERLRSVFFSVFTSSIVAMSWVGLSYEKPFYKSCDGLSWRSMPVLLSLSLLLFLLLTIYLPYFNSAFGLGSLNPLIFILSLVIGGASQLWFDFVKKRFN
jgi:Ca2+-transporting ATPase